jgi:hypothetical protein
MPNDGLPTEQDLDRWAEEERIKILTSSEYTGDLIPSLESLVDRHLLALAVHQAISSYHCDLCGRSTEPCKHWPGYLL